jgi:hypothetical protein
MEPVHYTLLREQLHRFPSVESLESLRRLGVRYVILHRGGFGPLKWARIERELQQFQHALRLVMSEESDYIYELSGS